MPCCSPVAETSPQSALLLKRQISASSTPECCPSMKYARTVQYLHHQHWQQYPGSIQLSGQTLVNSDLLEPTLALAVMQTPAAASSAVSSSDDVITDAAAVEQQFDCYSTTSSNAESTLLLLQSTDNETMAQIASIGAQSAHVGCGSVCSSSGDETDSCASEGTDEHESKLKELAHIVQQHKREAEERCQGNQTAVDSVFSTALTDTDAAIALVLSALSLATRLCDTGSPQAADQALELAERALTETVQRLATAQTLVLQHATE